MARPRKKRAAPTATQSPASQRPRQESETSASTQSRTDFDVAQHALRLTLCGVKRTTQKVRGLEKEVKAIEDLIISSVVGGEGNSMLVVGPRGSGKSLALNTALEKAQLHAEVAKRPFNIVRLSGFVHALDVVAMREIARQLAIPFEEPEGDNEEAEESYEFKGSSADIVAALLGAIRSGDSQSAQCIILVLDEFDLFAHSEKQSLLYSLFDASQSKGTPLLIIGLTCRLDVLSLLEKRVLSRFSRRQLMMFNSISFADYVQMFQDFLTLPEYVYVSISFREQWEHNIKIFMESPITKAQLHLQRDTTLDIRTLQNLALGVIARLSEDHVFPQPEDLFSARASQIADSTSSLLLSVSLLELYLCISASDVARERDETFNFEMVYDRYCKLMSTLQSEVRTPYPKAVAYKAFERLLAMELIGSSGPSGGKTPLGYVPMRMMVSPVQIRAAVERYPSMPTLAKRMAKEVLDK